MSVFTDIPSGEWLASNRSAFAVLDRFPVTEGHTLVIARREIPTWWEASPDERADIFALVDEVKAILDERHSPDGYNVGINAGQAAGQTVEHLHVHVIPRRGGDVDDPTGGVRHVIPGKANYLTPADPSSMPPPAGSSTLGASQPVRLVDAATPDRQLHLEVVRCLTNDEIDRIDLVVSFVMKSGLQFIDRHLVAALERGARIRVLTTDYLHITDADALARLLDLSEEYAEHAGSVAVRLFRDPLTSFHPKAYIFWSSLDRSSMAFVGSSNLSHSGIAGGVEWSVGLGAVDELRASFDALWDDSRSVPLDHRLLREYRGLWRASLEEPTVIELDAEEPLSAPQPRPVQSEALAALEATRAAGHRAGLVVMATGLGKTWLAAFDSTRPQFRRTLFVAHREEILRQSRDVFRAVRPDAELGLFHGPEKQPDADVVFASIQTLSRRLAEFDPGEFDYIVLDEFHHAAAASYRKVIDHFAPSFLLGLTATPDRLDGADLLGLCGDNLVFDCGLVEGIDRSELVPFHYWGIKDVTDFAPIPWRNGRFDPEALTRAVETEQRARQVLDEWSSRGGERTLGFCASITHADYMADYFQRAGVNALAVHSGERSASRSDAIADLRAGRIRVLFSVDVFNEGVDLPEVDAVMMLRPTESPIVFLQQLGRGLRTAEGKDHLDVIDLVGNHASFLMKPRVLLSLGGRAAPTNRELIDVLTRGEFDLPEGCSVHFEVTAIDLLRQLATSTRRGAIEEFCLDYADEHGWRPTAMQAFRSGVDPRSGRSGDGHWFAMLDALGLLSDEEAAVCGRHGDLLRAFEIEPTTKTYKLVTIRALLAEGALRSGGDVEAISRRARSIVLADPRLVADVRSASMPDPAAVSDEEWTKYWRKWPLDHLAQPKKSRALFHYDGDRFVPSYDVADLGDTFDAMIAELMEWRLAEHLLDGGGEARAVRARVARR